MAKVILIVDDDEKNMRLARDLMLAWGYECLEAADGKQGVDMAREKHPDLILMDLRLPVMDGLTATKLLRAGEKTKKIPVIMITSSAMRGDQDRILAAGCDRYVSKPFDIMELRAIIEQTLEETRHGSGE